MAHKLTVFPHETGLHITLTSALDYHMWQHHKAPVITSMPELFVGIDLAEQGAIGIEITILNHDTMDENEFLTLRDDLEKTLES